MSRKLNKKELTSYIDNEIQKLKSDYKKGLITQTQKDIRLSFMRRLSRIIDKTYNAHRNYL